MAKVIIHKSHCEQFLWHINWDLGRLWASWQYWKKRICANYEQKKINMNSKYIGWRNIFNCVRYITARPMSKLSNDFVYNHYHKSQKCMISTLVLKHFVRVFWRKDQNSWSKEVHIESCWLASTAFLVRILVVIVEQFVGVYLCFWPERYKE